MYLTYYTLRALVHEWQELLPGYVLADAFSHHRDELTLGLAAPEASAMLHISVRPSFRYLFRTPGYNRPRRNVTTLFPTALNRKIVACTIAHRDRPVFLQLEGSYTLHVHLFGPRPNVFLVNEQGVIEDAFQHARDVTGQPVPRPRPAPDISSAAEFIERWKVCQRKTLIQRLTCAWPLFDRTLAQEALTHMPLPESPTPRHLEHLFYTLQEMEHQLLHHPEPRIYWRDADWPETLALLPLQHLQHLREERLDSVDEAMRLFVRARLRHARTHALREPLRQQLRALHARTQRQLKATEKLLASPDRAEDYEKWGHLLMALAHQVPPGASEVKLPDLLTSGQPVRIPLDASRSAIENAERYYEKARQERTRWQEASRRREQLAARLQTLEELMQELEATTDYEQIQRFMASHRPFLEKLQGGRGDAPSQPFRRITLPGGYEVLIGRNARENEMLTFQVARPHDYWLHARGVPGAHVILRWSSKQQRPPRHILEHAAALAAYFSEARHAGLVPVQVTQRKYVRRLRGGSPGAVKLEREEVLLVEPAMPEATNQRDSV